jgi:hypothetical protein
MHTTNCSCGRAHPIPLTGPAVWIDCPCGLQLRSVRSVEGLRLADEAHRKHWADTMAGHRNVMRIGAELIRSKR